MKEVHDVQETAVGRRKEIPYVSKCTPRVGIDSIAEEVDPFMHFDDVSGLTCGAS